MREPDYKRERVQLWLGDCLELLPQLTPGRVNAVVTDPPYAIPTITAQGRNATSSLGDLSLIEHLFREQFVSYCSLVGPSGRCFVFCDGTSYPVIFRAAYGIFSTALLVWDKQKIGLGREFRKCHELIMHCWGSETPIVSTSMDKTLKDILPCTPVGQDRLHPAEKPVVLLKDLLLVCGPTVLDPFMGVGSTGVACLDTGHEFFGMEIEQQWFDLAVKRIDTFMNERSLKFV